MVFREERLFIIQYPDVPPGKREFFLRFLRKDQIGLKMGGDFPKIWTVKMGKICGPLLLEEENVYEVVRLNYDNRLIWLRQV
jgi:hypothetical protein